MNEMVERVMLALYTSGKRSMERGDSAEDSLAHVAVAAIAAMREPTLAMAEKGGRGIYGESLASAEIWRTMIDAVLAD